MATTTEPEHLRPGPTVRAAEAGSLNSARPVPRLVWALDDATLRRMHTLVGPRTLLRACWWCPVCEAPIHRPYRPGRHRVYCTNACRQKAYRARRRERHRLALEHCGERRHERANTREKAHAIRDFRDDVTGRRDSVGRGITACGTFARMSIDTPHKFWHTEFRAALPTVEHFTCRRCEQLSGVERRPALAATLSPGGP